MSVINSKERTKCPVSGCGKPKDPKKPCCEDCFKEHGLELVDAIKEACGVPVYIRNVRRATKKNVPTTNKRIAVTSAKDKTVALAVPASTTNKTSVIAVTSDPLQQVLELATKRLLENCLEVFAQQPYASQKPMEQEYLQFVVRVAYSDCPFPQVLELIPKAAAAAEEFYWDAVAKEVVRQDSLAAEQRLAKQEEGRRLERIERCKKVALAVLPKLPVEAVDPYALTAEILRQPANCDLPSQVLTADIKARLAEVQRACISADLINARCKWAVKNYLQLHPEDANLRPAAAAKKIAALRPKLDTLPTENLEKAFASEVTLRRTHTARGIETFMGLANPLGNVAQVSA
jgi:hypothetical protein